MKLKIMPETIEKIETWILIYAFCFISASIAYVYLALYHDLSKDFNYWLNLMFIWIPIAIVWGGYIIPLWYDLGKSVWLDIPLRLRIHYCNTFAHYSFIFIIGGCFVWTANYVFDIRINPRFAEIGFISVIINNPLYQYLMGGIIALYIVATWNFVGGYKCVHRGGWL